MTRRIVLSGATLTSAALFAVQRSSPSVALGPVARKSAVAHRAASSNGWPLASQVDEISSVWTRPVSGTGLTVEVSVGVPEVLLLHVVRRVHYEVSALRPGELVGWRHISTVRRHRPESNLASGTAVRIRPGARTDAYFALEELLLRDILADCQGMVRWGGDDRSVDQSLFYLDVPPDHAGLDEVARSLRASAETPGAGPGIVISFMEPARLSRARVVARGRR